MSDELPKLLDLLLNEAAGYRKKRKEKIKEVESVMLQAVEQELLAALARHNFMLVDYQYNEWIVAKRGSDQFRAWLPTGCDATLNFGVLTIKMVIQGQLFDFSVLVNHEFANVEYNYLGHHYDNEMLIKIERIRDNIRQLKELNERDIDGTYVVQLAERCEGSLIVLNEKLLNLEDCLEELFGCNNGIYKIK